MASVRLSMASVARRKAGVEVFSYDRARLATGIVHLGLGAFARAHLAAYTEDVLERDFGGSSSVWGIVGVSPRRPDQRDRLRPQGHLYTLIERSAEAEKARVIGCLRDVLVAAENPAAVVAAMGDTRTKIVSLTITEKGYCHDPATGRLQASHPDIRHDLETPASPRTAIGSIVAALDARRKAGLRPFTVLCCDNLPHNGRLVAGLARDFAAMRDDKLAVWIERHGAFPSTMVDRIVPAQTEADLAAAEASTGLRDEAPVSHEPFRQWVIEDRFVADERPAWEIAGAELVSDVAPFETMKLRLLNGSHSALAYLGYLGGHETIGDCVADPVYRRFVEALWAEEIVPVTPPPPGTDLNAYARSLLVRYDNPSIRHRTWQIAMDGSQKLPQRLLATVRSRLAQNLPIPRLALVVAAWMTYVGGIDEKGAVIDVRDPLAAEFKARLAVAGDDASARVKALLGVEPVFGTDLPRDARFVAAVQAAYSRLGKVGSRRMLAG